MPKVYTISGASLGAPFGQEAEVGPTLLPDAVAALLKAKIRESEDEIARVKKQSWYIAGGSAAIGILVGVFVGIAVK